MNYMATTHSSTLHDRAINDVGAGPEAIGLRNDWFLPVSEQLRGLAANRTALAIFRVGRRGANWDGFGSLPANAEAVSRAVTVADALVAQAVGGGLEWVDPHVGLNEAGEVSFEWWSDDKKLTMYLGPEATRYVSSWGANVETEMHAGALEAGQFVGLWRWLRTQGN